MEAAEQWQRMVEGLNRLLMSRPGCKFYAIIENPDMGSDLVTNMEDPVEQLGYLRGATICAEEYFAMRRRVVVSPDVEEHMRKTAEALSGKPPDKGSVN